MKFLPLIFAALTAGCQPALIRINADRGTQRLTRPLAQPAGGGSKAPEQGGAPGPIPSIQDAQLQQWLDGVTGRQPTTP